MQKTEVQNLLKNIGEVLQHYDIPDVNTILVKAINKKSDKCLEKEFIIDLVCETYHISRQELIYSKSNQEITIPRQIVFCLLNIVLGISIRKIAKEIFHFPHHNIVGKAILKFKKFDNNIKPDKEFIDQFNILRDKVLDKIQNKT